MNAWRAKLKVKKSGFKIVVSLQGILVSCLVN